MTIRTISAILVATAVVATPARAHHSFAMFDVTKTVVLVGTVKEFQFTAPHSWIQLMVPNARTGKPTEWSIEWRAPNQLIRLGVRRTTFKPGDKVTITVNPLRSGQPGGSLTGAILPDGKKVGQPIGERPPSY